MSITVRRLLACTVFALAPSAVAQEDYNTWTYRKDITINTSATGADVASDVANFPLLVRLRPDNGADIVHFSIGRGADLRFTKADGTTRLKHQIERWDSAQQIADVWVLVDTVNANSASQTIRVYWNKSGAADSSNGSAVFDTANGYAGVWHLGDAPGAQPRPNAIAGRFSATPRNFAPDYTVKPGIAGWSDSLTGGPNWDETAYLAINEGTPSDHFNFADGSFSYTTWFYPSATDHFARLVSLVSQDATGDDDRLFLAFNNGNIIGRQWADGSSRPTNSTTPPELFAWNHVAMTIVRGDVDTTRLYLNGEQIVQATITQQFAGVQRNYVRIGKDFINVNSDQSFNGRIDEPRISHVTRGPAYIRLSYQTQRPGATAVTQGAATPSTPPVPPPTSLFAARRPDVSLAARAVAGGLAFRVPSDAMRGSLEVLDGRGRVVWTRNLDAAMSGSDVTFIAPASGVYTARLVVRDAAGAVSRTLSARVAVAH